MTFFSVTRLRIRSSRFLPLFLVHMLTTLRQVKRAHGFQRGRLLADRHWTFWTLTAWDSQESMRLYMITGSHKKVMPRLLDWCDEASVAHWAQQEDDLPTWDRADQRMREIGRPSKVKHPSPRHASLTYDVPRTSGTALIRPA